MLPEFLFLIFLAKCFAVPPPGHIPTPSTDLNPPKYEYGYIVSDQLGGTQGHVESRDGIYALGRYHVTLPNGAGQKVTYFADDWGYHPLVSYSSLSQSGSSSTQFAVGDKAVAALKDAGSPAENLIGGSKGVQIINQGASGHFQHNEISVTTESAATSGGLIYSTTTVAPPRTVLPANTIIVANSETKFSPVSQEVAVSSTPRSPLINVVSTTAPHVNPLPYILPPLQYPNPSPLSNLLLRETPGDQKVQIVTPTPIEKYDALSQTAFPAVDDNYLYKNSTETAEFTHAGQMVQITSYLADTNRVLSYGDQIRENERQAEQKLLEQIQEHAKLRIFQDLENSLTPTIQPIVVVEQQNNKGTPVYDENSDFNGQQQTGGQLLALGYQQRLVNKEANKIVNEPDPLTQEIKKAELARIQEIELKKTQEELKDLQQKIINDIDAQHEEEQQRQKTVAEERQKHLDGLQKVEEVVQVTPSNEILPPLPDPSEDVRKSSFINNDYLPPIEPTQVVPLPPTITEIETQKQVMLEIGNPQQVPVIQEEMRDTLAPPPLPYFVHLEKPVLIHQPVPIESTKLLTVEKPLPIPQPYPVAVPIDRPVPIPAPYSQPIAVPYPVHHPIPYPQLVPYPQFIPFPFKQYHPVVINKPKAIDDGYHTIPLHLKLAPYHYNKPHGKPNYRQGRSKNSFNKNLRIEYGFKPPLVPSVEFSEEVKPSPYGSAVRSDK